MPKKFHEKIKRDIKKAHPNYSDGRAEQETNAVMSNINKGKFRKGRGGKMVPKRGARRK